MKDLENAIAILERTPQVVKALLLNSPEEWASIDEGERTWSPAMVLCHLIRGDKKYWMDNFRVILQQQPIAFAPFPKEGQFDHVYSTSIFELISEFTTIRKKNLRDITEAGVNRKDLSLVGNHANLGRVQLIELLSAWAVHDLEHVNQISRVIAKSLRSKIGPWEPHLKILNGDWKLMRGPLKTFSNAKI